MKYPAVISNNKNQIMKSTHIILPGVGSFGSAMDKIKSKIPKLNCDIVLAYHYI